MREGDEYVECTQCPPLNVCGRDVASRSEAYPLFRGSGCYAVWLYITSHCSLVSSPKRVEREKKRMGSGAGWRGGEGVLEQGQELSGWFKMLRERKLCLSATKRKPSWELDQNGWQESSEGMWGTRSQRGLRMVNKGFFLALITSAAQPIGGVNDLDTDMKY